MKGITHFFATGYFTLESGPATQSKSRRCATFAVSIAVHAAGFIAPIVLASAVMQLFSVWGALVSSQPTPGVSVSHVQQQPQQLGVYNCVHCSHGLIHPRS